MTRQALLLVALLWASNATAQPLIESLLCNPQVGGDKPLAYNAGRRCFDVARAASAILYKQKALTLSGASTTATGFIPAGVEVFGVTARVRTAITGAGVTGFKLGIVGALTGWGDGIALTAGTETSVADFKVASPTYFPTATNVVVTAIGGTFSGGDVLLTLHYRDPWASIP